MEEKKYARVGKYKGHTLRVDMEYLVMYHRSAFAEIAPMAAIRIVPQCKVNLTPENNDRVSIVRLNRTRLPAGTSISDAFTLLALAVPPLYRDLWHSIEVDEYHFAEWEGERRA